MKSKFLKFIILEAMLVISAVIISYAAQIDPSIPTFNSAGLSLSADGTARFSAPTYTGKWKRFDIQLMIRQSTFPTGATTPVYTYKEYGSIKQVDPSESEYTFNFTKEGYYQFQIRGVNLEGNYGAWAMIVDSSSWATYEGVGVSKDDISPGGGSTSGSGIGSGTNYNYGPGVVQYGYYPYGNQYYVIGPNGEILYNYGGNQSYNYYGNQQYAGMGIAQGPGYVNNYAGGNSVLYPNTGVSSYPVAPAPNVNGMYGYDTNYFPNTNQGTANSQTNPNYYNGGVGSQIGAGTNTAANSNNRGNGTPQITQGLEVGWHVDGNGRFYYQGNGSVLRGTWYFIDGSYYRFSDNGYALANQWFKDNSTGYWYFLAGDGRMLTGWQCINGVWYYFKPENGNGYGAMYSNTSIPISDAKYGTGYYAFDSNGANIMNAWFGGYYYGSDGKRTS